jgi:Tol biopolymer transport system component
VRGRFGGPLVVACALMVLSSGSGAVAASGTPCPELTTVDSGPTTWYADSGPEFSPDGTKIAFARDFPGRHAWETNLCILTPGGSGVAQRVIRLLFSSRAYSWGPDSRRLAVALVSSLEIVDADTGASTQIASYGGTIQDVQWSPTGSVVAFVGSEGVDTVHTDGSGLRLVVAHGWSPAWSPDGRRIAADRGHEIVTVNPNGTDAGVIVVGAPPSSRAAWSPTGDEVAYTDERGVWTAPAGGGEAREIAADTASDVSWSPRGDQIAYTGPSGTWVVSRDTLTAVRLGGPAFESPSWSGPDHVTYADNDLCGTGIYVADIARPGLAQRLTRRCNVFGDPTSTHARLLIKLRRTPASRVRTWTLRCGPVGGTLPAAARACARLLAVADPFGAWPKGEACGSPILGPAKAFVAGTFRRKHVRASFSRKSPCAAKRWNRAAVLFPGVAH